MGGRQDVVTGEADPVLQARLHRGLRAARRAFQEVLAGTSEPSRRGGRLGPRVRFGALGTGRIGGCMI